MLRRTLLTFATRFGIALLNFGTVLLTARALGAVGRGQISLFVTDIALMLLFIGLIGGSSLIYLAPRRNVWRLLVPAAVWATLVCGTGAVVVGLARPDMSGAYALHLGVIGLIQALFSIVAALLLGRRREMLFNLLSLLQAGLLVAGLAIAVYGLQLRQVSIFYYASYLAYGLPLLVAVLTLSRQPDRLALTRSALRRTTRELARHSRGAHLSNILVFLNYRLSYYFLAAWAGPGAVGVLSVGVALTEALWLIGRSVAQTQYVELVNAADKAARLPTVLRAARLTGLLTAGGLVALLAIPTPVLVTVFGDEFRAARLVLFWLAPGVLVMGVGMLLSTWFAGHGAYGANNRATAAGLLVVVPACALLIPRWGAVGAAAATSLSYLAVIGLLFVQFRRTTGAGVRSLLPRAADFRPAPPTLPAPP